MSVITDTASLAAFCAKAAQADYVTVDTEFIRDTTFWPRLCLVQLGAPDEAVAVDAMAPGIDLEPVWALMRDEAVVKVFHSARQDIEIVLHLSGSVPAPLFDTQVAAMVCGFGEAASYETLAGKLAGARLDKSMRFTDWGHRPLSARQIDYALSDVVHLRKVYDKLLHRLTDSGRADWVAEEMAILIDPDTYRTEPQEAWRRLKTRGAKRRFLAVLRELAEWRELEARRRDVPRSRVMKDEALTEIAASGPRSDADFGRLRGVHRRQLSNETVQALIAAVERGLAVPDSECPEPEPDRGYGGNTASVELLKVLLKLKCEAHDVAQKLVASADDIQAIAADDKAEVRALGGWRREVFGEDALKLKHGRIALTTRGAKLCVVPIEP